MTTPSIGGLRDEKPANTRAFKLRWDAFATVLRLGILLDLRSVHDVLPRARADAQTPVADGFHCTLG
jgi:hypothetical protein